MKAFSRLRDIIGSELHPWRLLASRALAFTGLSSLLKIERAGYRLHFFPSSLSMTLWTSPEAYKDEEDFLVSRLPEGGTYVDVGANIGPLVCAVASRCSSARIIAFEPDPRVFCYLKKNVELNSLSNVVLHNTALAAESCRLHISNKRADDMNFVADAGTLIEAARLDDMLEDAPRVDLLKIDVEGFELEVLKGARLTLSKTQQIYFEAYEPQYRRFGYGFSQVRQLLEGEGFLVARIQSAGRFEFPLPEGFVPHRCENMFAAKTLE